MDSDLSILRGKIGQGCETKHTDPSNGQVKIAWYDNATFPYNFVLRFIIIKNGDKLTSPLWPVINFCSSKERGIPHFHYEFSSYDWVSRKMIYSKSWIFQTLFCELYIWTEYSKLDKNSHALCSPHCAPSRLFAAFCRHTDPKFWL